MENAPLFKGCTRPPCLMGVPVEAFILVVGGWVCFSTIFYFPLIFFTPIFIYVLRKMTDKDDQVFNQLFSHIRLNVAGNLNRKHWKGTTSVSSIQKKTIFKNNYKE